MHFQSQALRKPSLVFARIFYFFGALVRTAVLSTVTVAGALGASLPEIRGLPSVIVIDEDTSVDLPFTLAEVDAPADSLMLSYRMYAVSPNGLTIAGRILVTGAGTNRLLQIHPLLNENGAIQLQLFVVDGHGASNSFTTSITVRAINDPPTYTGPTEITMTEGEPTATFTLSGTDPESRSVSFKLGSVPNSWPFSASVDPVGGKTLRVTPRTGSNLAKANVTQYLSLEQSDGQLTNLARIAVTIQMGLFSPVILTEPMGLGTNLAIAFASVVNLGDVTQLSPTALLTPTSREPLVVTQNVEGFPGSFSEEYLSTLPRASRLVWSDFNGDGLMDVLIDQNSLLDKSNLHLYLAKPGPGARQFVARTEAFSGFNARNFLVADLDGDGDIDVLASGGNVSSSDAGRIWRNDGQGNFQVELGSGLSGKITQLFVGDLNDDGVPDLVTCEPGRIQIRFNNGNGRFYPPITLLENEVASVQILAAGLVDVDGDGSLDLWTLESGSVGGFPSNQLVIRSVHGSKAEEIFRGPLLPSSVRNVPIWGDFDGDGTLDFFGPMSVALPGRVTTFGAPSWQSVVWANGGHGNFAPGRFVASYPTQTNPLFGATADMNGDGTLDLILPGGEATHTLFLNRSLNANIPPTSPTGLQAYFDGQRIQFLWSDSSDMNQKAALSYNIRVGTKPGANDLVPSLSNSDGIRLVPQMGNVGFRTTYQLNVSGKALGLIYWSVQAVDNSYAGSPWATENSLRVGQEDALPTFSPIADVIGIESGTAFVTIDVLGSTSLPQNVILSLSALDQKLVKSIYLSSTTNQDLRTRYTFGIVPQGYANGTTEITAIASTPAGLFSQRTFKVTFSPIDNRPSLAPISRQVALRGQPTAPVAVVGSDIDTAFADLDLQVEAIEPDRLIEAAVHRTELGWDLRVTPASTNILTASVKLTLADKTSKVFQIVDYDFVEAMWDLKAGRHQGGINSFSAIRWADIDADGHPDLIVTGQLNDTSASNINGIHVFLSSPGGFKTSQSVALAGQSVVYDMADINGDGLLDLLVGREDSPNSIVRVLLNQGSGRVALSSDYVLDFGIEVVAAAQVKFWDYDADGRPDAVGVTSAGKIVLFHNLGNRFERDLRPSPEGGPWRFSSSSGFSSQGLVADLGGDGRDRLAINSLNGPAQWLQADAVGALKVTPIQTGLFSLINLVDLDNDGVPELIDGGQNSKRSIRWQLPGGSVDKLEIPGGNDIADTVDIDGDGLSEFLGFGFALRPLGKREFSFQSLPEVFFTQRHTLPWDGDGDGVMDIAGISFQSERTDGSFGNEVVVYRGSALRTNTAPGIPHNLRAFYEVDKVFFAWDSAGDAQQTNGLTYNLRVGTAPGFGNVVSPESTASGHRLQPKIGNAGWSHQRQLAGVLPGQTLFWAVQAVDNSFAGGPFAPERTLVIPTNLPTIIGLKDLSQDVGTGELEVRFTLQGDREEQIVRAVSENRALVPASGVRIGGSVNSRRLMVSPEKGWEGQGRIRVEVETPLGDMVRSGFLLTIGRGEPGFQAVVRRSVTYQTGDFLRLQRKELDPDGRILDVRRLVLDPSEVTVHGAADSFVFWMGEEGPDTRGITFVASGPEQERIGIVLEAKRDPEERTHLYRDPKGVLGLLLMKAAGRTARLEVSEDLIQWRPYLLFGDDAQTRFNFSDILAPDRPVYFYRLIEKLH